ncbi:MAG: TIGR00730 family Rossman fold protein [Eubacterium sp.]|nr:TIGR00730 family Rossman fold protein [Eubacterium sp.]
MNITVYCGASGGNDKAYTEAAAELGRWIAENGHRLVYGAGKVGMMGAVADAVLEAGGKAIGVIPKFMVEKNLEHPGLDELIVVDTMAERKGIMMKLGDVFIALPGGSGTLEEISEIASRCQLGLMDAPCVLYNVKGYYDSLKDQYDHAVAEGFLSEGNRRKISFIDSTEKLAALITASSEAPK